MENFILPVPANSRISQHFAERPKFYRPLGFRAHPGIDYAVPVNTPVVASFWGEVCEMGWSKTGWGIYIKIKHGNLISLYAHLNRIKVVKGCYITRGQTLGRSGNSGRSSGPHLHFGLYDQRFHNNGFNGYIDPEIYLQKKEINFSQTQRQINAELNQIKKDGYTKDSMYIHLKYIEQLMK